jgi:hypothetical protein
MRSFAKLLTFLSSDAKMIMMSVVIMTTIANIYSNVNNFLTSCYLLFHPHQLNKVWHQ